MAATSRLACQVRMRVSVPLPAMNNTKQPPTVEEESSHEFYANLIGKKSQTLRNNATIVSATNRQRSMESLPIVATDETAAPVSNDAFNKVYRRALSDPPRLSSLSLDHSNKGFQLLSQMGWNEQSGGLGKRRQGNLTPVKTYFKNDKSGLGRGKKKELRVTHQPHERAAVEVKETKAQRRRRKKLEQQEEQNRQKRARMLLRTDVSDEYEQLYMSLHGA